MNGTLNATDVRHHWSEFNDDVVRRGPRFVRRNRDYWAALSSEQLKVGFGDYTFEAEVYQEDDGTFTVTLQGFDLVENGETKDETLDLMVDELIEYAREFSENFQKYIHAPNRRNHFPYIMNVLAQDDIESVKGLIQCPVGEK